MSTSSETFFDPFEAHFRRDPLPDAAVRVIVLAERDDRAEPAEGVVRALESLLAERNRGVESIIVRRTRQEYGWNEALHSADSRGPPRLWS